MEKIVRFVIFVLFPGLVFAESLFPVRVGTQWTFQVGNSVEDTKVDSFKTIKTPAGELYTATLTKSEGSSLTLLRSEDSWIECESVESLSQTPCKHAIVVLQTPLQTGAHWTSSGYEFVIMGEEAITTPFKSFPKTFRVSYSSSGSSDPLGEFWFVQGLGRVQIQEGDLNFRLMDYNPGVGAELKISPKEAIQKLLQESKPKDSIVSGETSIKKTWYYLENSKLFPLVLLQIVILGIFLILGLILWGALRTQKNMVVQVPEHMDVKEESKLLAALLRGGEVEKVENRLGQLVKDHPNYPDLRHQLALVQKTNGKIEEAKHNLEKALSINPNYIEARLSLGHLFLGLGENQKAKEQFQYVTERKPTFVDAILGLAKCEMTLMNFVQALKLFEKALSLNSSSSEARTLMEECRKLAQ